MSVPLFILSTKRSININSEILWIKDYPGEVFLVVDDSEKEEYGKVFGSVICHNCTGNMSKIRNFILDFAKERYGEHSWIVMCDDDVTSFEFYEEREWKVFDTGVGISELFDKLVAKYFDGYLLGANGVNNRFFKTLSESNYGFICADGFLVNLAMGVMYDETLRVKEDYYLVCKLLEEKKKVYALGNLNVCSKHYTNKGGIQSWKEERKLLDKYCQEYLLGKFPKYLRKHSRREFELSFIRKCGFGKEVEINNYW